MHAFIRDFNDIINKSSLVVGNKLNLTVSLPRKQQS